MTAPANDFDAAKAVADQLTGMDKERQQRVLRWVAESLGIAPLGPSEPAERQRTDRSPIDKVTPIPQVEASVRHSASMDIKSFVDAKKPKSDVQFAAVVAYYYRFETSQEMRRDSIDAAALQEAARLVGRRRPPSPRMTLNNAKNLGYLDTAERGQFRINSVGENLVAMTLPGGGVDAQPRRKAKPAGGRRTGATTKKKPRAGTRRKA